MKKYLILALLLIFSLPNFAKDGYELWLDYRPIENSIVRLETDRLFSGIFFFGKNSTYEAIEKELQLAAPKMTGKEPIFSTERLNQTQVWLGTREELAQVLGLQNQIDNKVDFETFFEQAPQLNENVSKITGVICGYRIEEIEDPLMKKVRYLDKLIDELAKGKAMEKILRK